MIGSLVRRSSARLAAVVVGLALISGVALPGAATAGTVATGRCPQTRITYSEAVGETTQFGWLLAPGSNGTNQRGALRYVVTGGTVICDSVALSNSSRHAISVRLYTADAYNTNDGGFAFTAFKDRPKGVGTWIELPFKRVTLPAGRSADIPILVRVPTNVTPGDTAGGVVAQDTKVRRGKSVAGASVGVRAGVGVRLYAQVAGLRQPELTVSKLTLDLPGGLGAALFGADSAKVSYQVTNSGNLILSPQATGQVTTPTSTTALPDHQLGETLPGGTAVFDDQVDGLRWGSLIGRVKVKVTVTAPGADSVTAVASGWRVPWLSLLALAILLALVIGFLVARRRRGKAAVDEEPVAEELEPVGS